MKTLLCFALGMLMWTVGCGREQGSGGELSFGEDLDFLRKHVDVVVLKDPSEDVQVAVVPAWQGRVMTSTGEGAAGASLGWINYDLIQSRQTRAHINPFGGEDRFWMGPEGGQFSIFFAAGSPFDLEHWQTPASIDLEAYEVAAVSPQRVEFRHSASLRNYSQTPFQVQIDRTVALLDRGAAGQLLGVPIPEAIGMVAFESDNRITNVGEDPWTRESGLLSIWILGMFRHSAETVVAIPYAPGSQEELGPVVNDDYFGRVPADRLRAGDNVIFFRADGSYRSKIGLSPVRAREVAGSFDPTRRVLTVVHYSKPAGAADYVNSMWELQDDPFSGDVINSYNDGPPGPGQPPLGPFYELETSSPAGALAPGETLRHAHRTFHFIGSEAELDRIARPVLGVTVDEIRNAFR